MNGYKYTLSRELYNSIKFGMRKNDKKGKKDTKALSHEEVLEYINLTFGLNRPVYELVITD